MLRKTPKGKSTDAGHRDGCARSRDEVLVMSMERRGSIILFSLFGTTSLDQGFNIVALLGNSVANRENKPKPKVSNGKNLNRLDKSGKFPD